MARNGRLYLLCDWCQKGPPWNVSIKTDTSKYYICPICEAQKGMTPERAEKLKGHRKERRDGNDGQAMQPAPQC